MARGDTDENGNPIDPTDPTNPTRDTTPPGARPTRQDIVDWYQRYMGRAPESEAIIQGWMTNPQGKDAVLAAIANSPEAKAYNDKWQKDNPQNPPPKTDPAPRGGGAPPGGLLNPFTETFTPPTPLGIPDTPVFHPPTFTPGAPFKGPDAQSVLNDPGYQFRLNQGEQALTNNRAAQGLMGTGGTLKDILGYGQDYASNEFQNVWNRDLGTYNTNYQTQTIDPYNKAYQSALDQFAPQMTGYQNQVSWNQHANDMNYTNTWNHYLQDWNQFKDQRDSTFDKLFKYGTA